jgi:hypothetical protein
LVRDAQRHTWPVEDVAAVHHEVDFARERGRERGLIVREEIVAAAPPIDARARRQVEAEVRIGEQQDAEVGRHAPSLPRSAFLR